MVHAAMIGCAIGGGAALCFMVGRLWEMRQQEKIRVRRWRRRRARVAQQRQDYEDFVKWKERRDEVV